MSTELMDIPVKAYESGGPIAAIAVSFAVALVTWVARREFKRAEPLEPNPVAEAIDGLTREVRDMNLARARHEAQTDARLGEHERRLDGIDRRLDRRE